MRLTIDKKALRPVLLTFLAAWLVRLALAWAIGSFHNFDRRDMERLALALAQTGTIANMMVPGLPSAGESPGYVILLAGIFRLFGDGALGEAVKVFACTAASSLRCALTVWIASRLQLGRTVMMATAVLSVFWIGALNTELQGDWDPPYTSVALILLCWLQESCPAERRSPGRAALLGCAWALGAYLNFSIFAVLAGFMFRDLLVFGKRDFQRFLGQSVCLAAGVFVVLSPWVIRNRITLGEWVPTRDMLGYGLALSYHDGAHWGEPFNNHPGRLIPGHENDFSLSPYPFLNVKLRPEVARLGEVEWDRQKRREGLTWMAAHPGRSLVLMAQHTFFFWFPPSADFTSELPRLVAWPYAIAKWMLTLLALAGWLRLRHLAAPAAQWTAVILLTFPLVYYLVNWSSRYRAPIEWVFVLLAGVAIAGIYDRYLARTFVAPSTYRP
jgi:hypothetical protein